MWFKRKYLRFLLLFSLVFSMICLKNTCNAYSIDDYIEFLTYLKDNNITNTDNSISNYNNAISACNNLKTYANVQNIDLTNLTGIFYSPNSWSGYSFDIYFTRDSFTYYCQNRYSYQNNSTLWYDYYQSYGSNNLSNSNSQRGGIGRAALYEGEPTNRYLL